MNMSYCRFSNTVSDLQDCYEEMENVGDLSEEEVRARRRMLKLCKRIAEEYESEITEIEEEDKKRQDAHTEELRQRVTVHQHIRAKAKAKR